MSTSPQFLRTDKAIIQALIRLLKRKPFEKITVQDILDETPVTRATFYAHFRDKYEIAERMMEQFFATRDKIRHKTSGFAIEDLRLNAMALEPEFTQALLKIRTDKVDFRRMVAADLEREYLSTADGPNRELEARVFAQAYVEIYIYLITNGITSNTAAVTAPVLSAVAEKLLQQMNNPLSLERMGVSPKAGKLPGEGRK